MTLKVHTTHPQHALAQIDQVLTQRGIPFSLRRYRREQQQIDDLPVFALAYSVRLNHGDNRSALTSKIIDGAVISMHWQKEKPSKG